MKRTLWVLVLIPCLAGLAGCATPGDDSGFRDVSEVDRRFQTAAVDAADYNKVIARMVDSMLARVLENETGGKPLIVLGDVINHTPHNIRREMILNKIKVEMLRPGTVRFTSATSEFRKGGASGSLYRQLEFQNESGHVDPATIQKYGGLLGAEYILYGIVENLEREANHKTQAYFSFIMELHSVRTGEVIWADEEEITKITAGP